MCLNLNGTGKSNLRYATEDKVCYKVLKIQNFNNKESLHAPYYVEFEYELNKKYNTEMNPGGYNILTKDISDLYYRLNFKIAQAINQYYDRIRTFRYVTCGFHTVSSLKVANYLKKEFIDDDFFHSDYRIFECIIPKGSWYYVGFDDSFNEGFVSDSLIVKKEIKCV